MMEKLLNLLELQKEAHKSKDIESFGFQITNSTQKLFPYKQGVFWTLDNNHIHLERISGNAVIDRNGLYAIEIKKYLKEHVLKSEQAFAKEPLIVLSQKDAGKDNAQNWEDLFSKQAVITVFATNEDGVLGGLWLDCDKAPTPAESKIFANLIETYAYTLATIRALEKRTSLLSMLFSGKKQKIILAALLILFFFPTRLSITAPAEIVADNPHVITIPYEGILEDVLVDPGDEISAEQIIAQMDQTTIKAQADRARQSLATTQTTLSRTGLESLRNEEKRRELQQLRSEIAEKRVELEYAQDLLERTSITSPVPGVAIFADANSLEGKPMQTGEKLMMIADPEKAELLIRVPLDSMLPVTQDNPVDFYLNVSPLKTHRAKISSIGYQASQDPDGLMTYKIKANLQADETNYRIGWEGTAKIKGAWSILGYAVLRKPLIALRNLMGL